MITNTKRLKRARIALAAYIEAYPNAQRPGLLSQEEVMTDLFSDLGHLAAVKCIDLRQLFNTAMMNVEAERAEEDEE